jgi:hypothetical protein
MLSAGETHQAAKSGIKKEPGKAPSIRTRSTEARRAIAAEPESAKSPCILQSTDTSTDRIQVAYQQRHLQCELSAGKHPLLMGPWHWEVIVGKRSLDSSDEVDSACWENTCWEQNIDVSYVEMQLDLPSGLQIQRQILLARRDRFALLADVVAIPGDVDSVYRCRLTLGDQLSSVPAAEGREITLFKGRRAVARVLPISLPEWRRQPSGELKADDGLTLTQPLPGRRGHVALFIDLDPQRIKRQLTWRQLTVAESLQIVARDIAAGYRIQIGREQWLIYRSLAPSGNRTVLGQNFSTEFVVARFRPNGIAEKILEIL